MVAVMDMTSHPRDDVRLILEEMRVMRAEIVGLHREMLSALAGIREVIDEMHRIEGTETAISSELDNVSQRLDDALPQPPSLSTCEACGSAVERHPAQQGVLLICKACGHTVFRDRRTIADRREFRQDVQEGALAEVEEPVGWISDPRPE
jgi:hypothetical protein